MFMSRCVWCVCMFLWLKRSNFDVYLCFMLLHLLRPRGSCARVPCLKLRMPLQIPNGTRRPANRRRRRWRQRASKHYETENNPARHPYRRMRDSSRVERPARTPGTLHASPSKLHTASRTQRRPRKKQRRPQKPKWAATKFVAPFVAALGGQRSGCHEFPEAPHRKPQTEPAIKCAKKICGHKNRVSPNTFRCFFCGGICGGKNRRARRTCAKRARCDDMSAVFLSAPWLGPPRSQGRRASGRGGGQACGRASGRPGGWAIELGEQWGQATRAPHVPGAPLRGAPGPTSPEGLASDVLCQRVVIRTSPQTAHAIRASCMRWLVVQKLRSARDQ